MWLEEPGDRRGCPSRPDQRPPCLQQPGHALCTLGRRWTQTFRGLGPLTLPVPSQQALDSSSLQRARGVDSAGHGHGSRRGPGPLPGCLSPHLSPLAGPGQADGLGQQRLCPRGLPPVTRVTSACVPAWAAPHHPGDQRLSPCDRGGSFAHVPFCPLSWTQAECLWRSSRGLGQGAQREAPRWALLGSPRVRPLGATRGSRPRAVLWGPHGGPGQTGGPEVVERCGELLTWWWPAVPEKLSQEGWGSEARVSFQPEPSGGGQGVNHTGAGSLVPWSGVVNHTDAPPWPPGGRCEPHGCWVPSLVGGEPHRCPCLTSGSAGLGM